jgi:hypothetical protein
MKLTHKHYCLIATMAMLVACGGGSSNSGTNGVGSNGAGGGTGSTSSTFAAPSTFSSSANTMDLLTHIESGGISTLPVFGLVLKQDYKITMQNSIGGYDYSSRTYDLIDTDINIGLNKIYYDDKNKSTRQKDHYLKNITGLPGIRYINVLNDSSFVIDPVLNYFFPQYSYGTLQHIADGGGSFVSSGIGSYVQTVFGSHAPYLSYGLKTDSNDVPTTTTVTYKASLSAFTGDGAPVSQNGDSFMNTLTTGCGASITLTLNTSTGELITSPINNCLTPDSPEDKLSFSLGKVYFVNSTLRKDNASASAASFTAVGRLGGDPNYVNAQITTHTAQSTKISGAIYGKGASTILIQGSGVNGAFHLIGRKQ